MILWYTDENRICGSLAYGKHGQIKESYSNVEQIINDWQHDERAKPISLGNLNKHSWSISRIKYSPCVRIKKRKKNRQRRGVKDCSVLTMTTKRSLSQTRKEGW